jgi:hypothetical protein
LGAEREEDLRDRAETVLASLSGPFRK